MPRIPSLLSPLLSNASPTCLYFYMQAKRWYIWNTSWILQTHSSPLFKSTVILHRNHSLVDFCSYSAKIKQNNKKEAVNFIVFSNIIETDSQHSQIANSLPMWYIFTCYETSLQKHNCFLMFSSKSQKGQSVLSNFTCFSAFWTEIYFIHPLWNTAYGKIPL